MRWVPAMVAVVAVVSACGGGQGTATPGSATPSAPESGTDASPATEPAPSTSGTASGAVGSGVTVRTGDSDFGRMLFDGEGQAIYLFDKERTSRPACYKACAQAWPPVLSDGIPNAAGAVRPALLGTTTRSDGTVQVTYGGHPLYYYAHEGPGQVLCHNVSEFGGLWLVVTPPGDPR